jgi:hypothetical protein
MGGAHPPLPDLDAPEFAPIKTKLALAFIDHKADLGVDSDREIVERVDDITAILFGLTCRPVHAGDHEWIARFGWFGEILDALDNDVPGKPLDG